MNLRRTKKPAKDKSWYENFKYLFEFFTGIGVIASITYAFGLLFISVQIVFRHELSFMDAWYAASLIPKEIIIAQMFKISASGWAIFFSSICYMSWFGPKLTKIIHLLKNPRLNKRVATSLFSGFIVLFFFSTVFMASSSYFLDRDRMSQWVIWAAIMSFSVMVMVFATACIYHYERHYKWPRLISILQVIIVVYIFAFTSSTFAGNFNHLPIPKVSVKLPDSRTIDGFLLGHSSGYWHILSQRSQMLSISDSQAPIVVITRGNSVLFPNEKQAS